MTLSVIVTRYSRNLGSIGASGNSETYTIMVASRTMLAVLCEVGEV